MAPGSLNDDKHGVEHDAAEHDCRVTYHQPGLHHLIRNLTWLVTGPSPIYWSKHLAALTWSDQNPCLTCPSGHQPALLVLLTISHNDQKLSIPHLWSPDINRTFTNELSFIKWSTRTENAVSYLWSHLDYHAVYSAVCRSQDQLLSTYDDKVFKPYWLTNL